MIRAANAPLAFTPTSLWRAASVSVGGLVFGLAAAPVLPLTTWLAAAALGAAFAAAFLGGAGYSILHAVARRDVLLFRPANWSDGVTATAGGVLAASAVLLVTGLDPVLLLLGLGLGLAAAYVPAKLGCIEAGCCAAGHRRHQLDPGIDLRVFEIAASVSVLALAAATVANGHAAAAAAVALGGHLCVRLHSRLVRGQFGATDHIPPIWLELAPLALATFLSIGVATAG